MTTAYDEVAYPSLPLHQTRPDGLAVQVRLRGLPAAQVATARVLEIGCSDAGNLAALAAYAPEATFVGIDLSETAVQRAQNHGLPNLQVLQADLTQFAGGEFDYVIAHGVFSWIPHPDDLLACVARHLAPNAVAYISYNTMPGWAYRDMAAGVLRREAGTDVSAARAVAEDLLRVPAETDATRAMQSALRHIMDKPDHVLRHDELAQGVRAFYIDEVIASAAAHGLHYAGESHLGDCAESDEQWHDYATNRMFRMSLFTRQPVGPVTAEAISGLLLSAPARSDGRGGFMLLRGARVEVDPGLAADLQRIGAAWPATIAGNELASDPAAFLTLYRHRVIELHSTPLPAVRPADRPYVVEYMRERARIDGLIATGRHELVRLEDDLSRRAVSLMDGRHSRSQIAEVLRSAPDARVRRDLDALIEALADKGLFVSPPAAIVC